MQRGEWGPKKLWGLEGFGKGEVAKFKVFGPYASRNVTIESSRRRTQILCTFHCKSKTSHSCYRVICTYIHIMDNACNGQCSKLCCWFTWHVRRDVSCILKYFSNCSCRTHHQCLIFFAVELPFIIDSIASLKRTR